MEEGVTTWGQSSSLMFAVCDLKFALLARIIACYVSDQLQIILKMVVAVREVYKYHSRPQSKFLFPKADIQ